MDNERLNREVDRALQRAEQRKRKSQREQKMPVHGRSCFVLQTALAKRAVRSNAQPSIDVKQARRKQSVSNAYS